MINTERNILFQWLIVGATVAVLWIFIAKNKTEYEQISLQGNTYEDAVSKANRRLEADHYADWKVKLSLGLAQIRRC